MLNVNELTSRMAKMSDAQLRQYAQIHKNDPYTLALAASESKRRAQLRAGGQQQAAQQPTVADQAIAQMGAPAPMPQPQLPEQQGIGMLPAENVAGMADGGIAGYDDQFVDSYANAYAGGGIVAFKDEGLVRKPMTAEERAELERYQKENFDRLYGLKDWASGIKKDVVDWFTADRSNIPFESKSPMIKYGTPKYTGIMEYERPETALARERQERGLVSTPALEQFQAPPPVEKEAGWAVKGKKKGEKSSYPAPIDESAGYAGEVYTPRNTMAPDTFAPYNKNTQAGRDASARQGSKTTPPPPPPTETMKAPTGEFTPSKETTMEEQLKALEKLSPGTKAYDDLKRDIEKGFSRLQKEREESKPKGKPYEGLEALLAKEEDKAKGKEARNFNMALVNAGLAIAGGRSQYALQNIAEGAQVGTKQYQEGLEKLEAAAVERRKQAALIEEARRAELRGDWKEEQQLKRQAFEVGIGVDKERISAIQDIFKTNSKTAADIVNTANTNAANDRRARYQQDNENFRAQLREAGDNWRLVAKNTNDVKVAQIYSAARAAYGANAGDKIWDNARQRHDSWLKSPEGRMADTTTADAKFQEYLNDASRAYGGSSGGNKNPQQNPQQNPYSGWGNLQVTPGAK